MKHILSILLVLPCISFGQYTAIPDTAFEQALIDLGYDAGTPDGSVPTANIDTVTSLNLSGFLHSNWTVISDLTGIEDFAALTELHCDSNQLTSLDVSNNINLEELRCNSNNLGCLNVKNGNNWYFTVFLAYDNPNLTCIEVDDTAYSNANWVGGIGIQTSFSEDCNNACKMTYVPDDNFENYLENNSMGDGIANNDSVLTANISSVTNLNLSMLAISDLTGIEDFVALTNLDCSWNQPTSLNVSNNTALTRLDCGLNGLTSLDLSNNVALTFLACDYNQLTSLDVSNNINLEELGCNQNQLICLNVKNGNNTNMIYFHAYLNPNLTCIEVDDTAYSNANWVGGIEFSFDTPSFREQCNYPASCWSTGIQEHTSSLKLYPNPFSVSTTIELPSEPHILTIYDIVGNRVRTEQVSGKTLIERGDLTKGIYIIELRSKSHTYEGKLVVE